MCYSCHESKQSYIYLDEGIDLTGTACGDVLDVWTICGHS